MIDINSLRPNVRKNLDKIKNEPSLQPIQNPPLRAIKSVQFGILSPEEIKAMSVCNITNSRITQPPTDTVYDERMGPSHSRGICSTCNEDIRVCPGHFGHIELAQPIIHPMFIKFLVTILNCVCLECSRLRMTREDIELEIDVLEHDRFIKYIDRLNIINKKCTSVAYCVSCNFPHPEIKEIDGNIYQTYGTIDKNEKKTTSLIEIEDLYRILSNITNEDLETMGFQPRKRQILRHSIIVDEIQTFRPEWLIMIYLPVIPPMSRPPDHEGDNRSDDDLTTSYTDIIKYNEKLKQDIKEKDKENTYKALYRHISALCDNSDGSVTRNSGKPAKGIKERIVGKGGIIRKNLAGKRVDCSARTVITADIQIPLNGLGIPEKEVAQKLSFPEKITPRNIKEMYDLLEAGKLNSIVRGNENRSVSQALKAGRKIKLKYGDIVYRHLKDGDTVVFNRQPTLHRGSIMTHTIKILPGKTFRLNLGTTAPYNADFDGDEMQLHVPQDYGTAVEVQTLMSVNKQIVSAQASKPIMGIVQDSLVASYLMTHPDVSITKSQFMDCVFSAGEEYVKKLPGLIKRALSVTYDEDNKAIGVKKGDIVYKSPYNGRVLYSILFPENFQYVVKNNASKTEPVVIIKNGILISGIIDKKIIGKSHGCIHHRLFKEKSPDEAAKFLTVTQYLTNRWFTFYGFSVGMKDLLISDENKEKIKTEIQKAYTEVENIQNSDDPAELKEFRINSTLNNRGQGLAINGLCPGNRIQTMIESGSKGSKINLIQIVGKLGQNNVEGRRIQEEIDDGNRTLACFKPEDKHPRTKGFIENSFMSGLTPAEFFFHAKAGREGIINTAVKTRESGYAERRLVKRMEDLVINIDHSVRNSVNNIIDFTYGDSFDPVHIYHNNGPSFIDIDNLVNELNSDDYEEPSYEEAQEILYESKNLA